MPLGIDPDELSDCRFKQAVLASQPYLQRSIGARLDRSVTYYRFARAKNANQCEAVRQNAKLAKDANLR
jgi:hypothetical protein